MSNSKRKPQPRMTVKNGKVYGDALSAEEKKRLVAQKKKDKKSRKVRISAQQTIPYVEMCRDGICKVNSRLYTKSIRFEDINYQLAQNEDKTGIFENWCDFLNYFDSSIFVQLSFINQKTNIEDFKKSIHIPEQDDNFNDIRTEYSDMLQNQLMKGNNGLIKRKYITFGIEAESLRVAKAKLERIELDVLNNFKSLGVKTYPLSGYERLKVLHDVFNMDNNDPFRFSFDMVARTGLSSKDFIAPTSFDFREGKCFKMGKAIGAVSFLQILAPEGKFHSRLQNAKPIAHVIAPSLKIIGIHPLLRGKAPARVSELNLTARAGYGLFQISEDLRRDDIPAQDRHIAGRLLPLRLLHHTADLVQPAADLLSVHTALFMNIVHAHGLHAQHGLSAVVVYLHQLFDAGLLVIVNHVVPQQDCKGLVTHKTLGAQDCGA